MSVRDLSACFDVSTCRICGCAAPADPAWRATHADRHLADASAIVEITAGVQRVVPNGPHADGLTDDVDADVARRAVAEAFARKHAEIRLPRRRAR